MSLVSHWLSWCQTLGSRLPSWDSPLLVLSASLIQTHFIVRLEKQLINLTKRYCKQSVPIKFIHDPQVDSQASVEEFAFCLSPKVTEAKQGSRDRSQALCCSHTDAPANGLLLLSPPAVFSGCLCVFFRQRRCMIYLSLLLSEVPLYYYMPYTAESMNKHN